MVVRAECCAWRKLSIKVCCYHHGVLAPVVLSAFHNLGASCWQGQQSFSPIAEGLKDANGRKRKWSVLGDQRGKSVRKCQRYILQVWKRWRLGLTLDFKAGSGF